MTGYAIFISHQCYDTESLVWSNIAHSASIVHMSCIPDWMSVYQAGDVVACKARADESDGQRVALEDHLLTLKVCFYYLYMWGNLTKPVTYWQISKLFLCIFENVDDLASKCKNNYGAAAKISKVMKDSVQKG